MQPNTAVHNMYAVSICDIALPLCVNMLIQLDTFYTLSI